MEGNERLTAMTGALLLGLFGAEGITILALRQLLTLHFFLGMLLIGPVILKTGSAIYRFVRYYTGAPTYRSKGPPALAMRLLGPFVILTSFGVIGTGVMVGFSESNDRLWLTLHRGMFVAWFAVMTIHVAVYLGRLPRELGDDMVRRLRGQARHVLAGRGARWLLLAASMIAGLLIAMFTYHHASVWLNTHHVSNT